MAGRGVNSFRMARSRAVAQTVVWGTEVRAALIHDGVSEQELERHARLTTPSIRDDGRTKVLRGETTLEEVLRVTRED